VLNQLKEAQKMTEGPQYPYQSGNHNGTEQQIVDTIEAFAWLGAIWWVCRGMKRHAGAGVILVLSLIIGGLVLTQADMTSDWAYVFWACVVTGIISIGRLIS